MRLRRPSHGTLVAYVALFIALGGTTYAATGGNFILGQSNTAGTPTRLSSPTTDNNGALRVSNTSTGTGNGVVASGAHGGFGVWASGGDASKNKAAIHGQSGAGNAVEGISGKDIASGVYGQNNSTGFGVGGRSANGTGVMGDSANGWAMQAFGNASQTRGQSGFVKAMAYVNPFHTADPIKQCFDSQLPPAQATSGDCGITYGHPGNGTYTLDFPFQVDDRFLSVTTTAGGYIATALPHVNINSRVAVQTSLEDGTAWDQSFYLLIY